MIVHTVLLIISAILILLGVIGVPENSKISLAWLGMFFFVLSFLFTGVASLIH